MRGKVYKIPRKQAKKILREAMSIADRVHCDQLDCSVSIARQPTDKTTEEVLAIGLKEKKCHLHFIERHDSFFGGMDFYDVGLSTVFSVPNYFLWITLSIDNGEKLAEKYKLKRTQ